MLPNALYIKRALRKAFMTDTLIYKNAINRIRGKFTPGDLVEIKDWRGSFWA